MVHPLFSISGALRCAAEVVHFVAQLEQCVALLSYGGALHGIIPGRWMGRCRAIGCVTVATMFVVYCLCVMWIWAALQGLRAETDLAKPL